MIGDRGAGEPRAPCPRTKAAALLLESVGQSRDRSAKMDAHAQGSQHKILVLDEFREMPESEWEECE